MASLSELARLRARLPQGPIDHLQRLVAAWGVLADLSFADHLLWAPTDPEQAGFVVLAHIRPVTSQTIYRRDRAGDVMSEVERPIVARCSGDEKVIEGEIDHSGLGELVLVHATPIRYEGRVIAVVTRETAPSMTRQPGELERTYLAIAERFAEMVAAGVFPYATDDRERVDYAPRVPDGVILLDRSRRVEFTSPNAVSALVRLGVSGQPEGMTLSELGLEGSTVRRAFGTGLPATEEVERGGDTVVVLRCLPLMDPDGVSGGVLMLRDVSELRRRDRMLVSKDATIREIHHRVKNNLQTISSLLRLQGRRLTSPEAKAAVDESVRRIRSIALVHETLSRDAGEDVPFIEIVRPLVRMVEEGYSSLDRPLHFKVSGDAGKLPATMATPLAVVLTELLQNVVDHAYPVTDDVTPGEATVELDNDGDVVRARVTDDGVGLPDDFELEATTGLGLQIVQALVRTELGGEIEMRPRSGAAEREGTVVELTVPIRDLPGPLAEDPGGSAISDESAPAAGSGGVW